MNRNISESPAQGSAAPDRAILCIRLEETRVSFHTLIASLTDEEWGSKRTSTRWTARELIAHIVDGLAHTPEAIEHVRRGKQFLNLPPFLNWLTAPINLLMSKWSARGQTRQTTLARYDTAHQALLATIEGIQENEWARGALCYGEGYKTVRDLCEIPSRHLQEHTVQLARS
jgi:DinB superfamily